MLVSKLSSLEYDYVVEDGHAYEKFTNKVTGYSSVWNAETGYSAKYLLEGHTGKVLVAGDPSKEKPNLFALHMMARLIPPASVAWTPLDKNEKNDLVPWTHTTGPSARRYTSPALRYAVDLDAARRTEGLGALRSFSNDEHQRPLSHVQPFDVREDLSINKDTANSWTTDQKTTAGFNAWDPAHCCLANEFASAIVGQDEGLEAFIMQWRILAKGFPSKTSFWYNQQRATAWSLICDWEASWLGLSDDFCRATGLMVGPKESLKARLRKICSELPYDPLVSGPADDRVMEVIGQFSCDGVDYGVQCHGEYMWQKAMRTTSLALIASDSLLSDDGLVKKLARDYALKSVKDMYAMYVHGTGIAWCANYTLMPYEVAAKLIAMCTAQGINSGRKYIAYPVSGLYKVGEVPIAQDCALHLLGWLLLYKERNAVLDDLYRICPSPGATRYEPQVQDASVALYLAMGSSGGDAMGIPGVT